MHDGQRPRGLLVTGGKMSGGGFGGIMVGVGLGLGYAFGILPGGERKEGGDLGGEAEEGGQEARQRYLARAAT